MSQKPSYEELEAKVQILMKTDHFFRSAPTAIGVASNRIITRINNRLEAISGYSRKELLGQKTRILYPSEDDFRFVGQENHKQIDRCGTGTVETRWQRKDGLIIDILLSSTPIDIHGDSKTMVFTAVEITEAKKDRAALLESEEHYRSMMEAQEDPTYICSSNFRLEYMNPAMVQWIGQDRVGQKCYEALWGEPRVCSWCPHKRVMAKEKVAYELKSPLSERVYHVVSAPIYHADDSISILTSYRDVSEIKLLNLKLQQVQKIEAIGSLAGGVAHDFNNILFPIIGMSEMMMEDLPSESVEWDYAHEINKAGQRATELVSQILAFSRQSEQEMLPVRFQQILKEVLKLCRSTIPANIEITREIHQDCGSVWGNAVQLHQIAMNLITNAYHAIEPDHGEISVTLCETEFSRENVASLSFEPGRYVMLSVSDTGSGISPSLLSKIFDPYFTTKEKGKGTGLGLSVVHGIVKEYGGDIQVFSEVGKGTKFIVYIPLMEKNLETTSQESTKISPTGNESILLVDDEKQIIQMGKNMLERLGYAITSCTGSLDALETFRANPHSFDLVISDMAMPHMSGDQLAKKLLAINPDIPIIMFTGFSEMINKEKADAMGIKGFLMKPVVKAEMAEEIRRVLDGGTPGPAAP